MSMKLDGKAVSAQIKDDLRERVANLKRQGATPGLGTLLVGNDPGSVKYVAGKHSDCEEVGIRSIKRELPEDATFDQIAQAVRDLSQRDKDEHGLSAGEKRMLTKARKVLTAEISISEKISEEETQRLLDVNLGFADPQPGDEKHHTFAPDEPASETLHRIEMQGAKSKKRAVKKTK